MLLLHRRLIWRHACTRGLPSRPGESGNPPLAPRHRPDEVSWLLFSRPISGLRPSPCPSTGRRVRARLQLPRADDGVRFVSWTMGGQGFRRMGHGRVERLEVGAPGVEAGGSAPTLPGSIGGGREAVTARTWSSTRDPALAPLLVLGGAQWLLGQHVGLPFSRGTAGSQPPREAKLPGGRSPN